MFAFNFTLTDTGILAMHRHSNSRPVRRSHGAPAVPGVAVRRLQEVDVRIVWRIFDEHTIQAQAPCRTACLLRHETISPRGEELGVRAPYQSAARDLRVVPHDELQNKCRAQHAGARGLTTHAPFPSLRAFYVCDHKSPALSTPCVLQHTL